MGSDVYGLPSRKTYPDSQVFLLDAAKVQTSFHSCKFFCTFLLTTALFPSFFLPFDVNQGGHKAFFTLFSPFPLTFSPFFFVSSRRMCTFAGCLDSLQRLMSHILLVKRTFTNVIFSIWISQIQALEDTQPKRPHWVYCTLPLWASSIYLGVGYRVAYPSARQCESPDAG